MKKAFYTKGEKPNELYLNIVMEYIPETIYSTVKNYSKRRTMTPIFLITCFEDWLIFTALELPIVTSNPIMFLLILLKMLPNCEILVQPKS